MNTVRNVINDFRREFGTVALMSELVLIPQAIFVAIVMALCFGIITPA